jgi:hypothetical protein
VSRRITYSDSDETLTARANCIPGTIPGADYTRSVGGEVCGGRASTLKE